MATQMHGQHQVGLLDDLLAVEIEVGNVQQERVVLFRRGREVPYPVFGEGVVLRVDSQLVIVRDEYRSRRVSPRRHLVVPNSQSSSALMVPSSGLSRGQQVVLGQEIRIDVIVSQVP